MTDYSYILERLGYRNWVIREDYESLEWHDLETKKPTKEFLDAAYLEWKSAGRDYKEKRALEYPSIVDQLDLLFHVGYVGWKKVIQEVKDRFPKP